MRKVLMVVLLFTMSLGMVGMFSGCVSVEDQQQIDKLTQSEKSLWMSRVRAIETLLGDKKDLKNELRDKIGDIRAGIGSGTLTFDQGQEFIISIRADVQDTISDIEDEIRNVKDRYSDSSERISSEIGILREKGYGGFEIAMAGLLSLLNIGGSLGAVRAWRGGVNNRTGDIGVRSS